MERTGGVVRRGLAEFVIVVFGVLAALAAENWSEARADRRTGREYIERIRIEIHEGTPTLVFHLNRLESALAAIDSLLGRVERESPMSETDSVRLVLASSDYSFNPAGVVLDLTYREMLSTGALNLIDDIEVRDAISRYYRAAYRLEDVLDGAVELGGWRWQEMVLAAAVGGSNPVGEDRERLLSLLSSGDAQSALRTARNGVSTVQFFLSGLMTSTESLLDELPGEAPAPAS